jgi:hypothetical protein
MGAGKSTFARFLLEALGVAQSPEGSPTFAVAHEYASPLREDYSIIHIDLYRLKSEEELEHAGISAYFWERDALVLCEWMSMFPDFEKSLKPRGARQLWRVQLDWGKASEEAASGSDTRDVRIWKHAPPTILER